jgi:hypothetical protein
MLVRLLAHNRRAAAGRSAGRVLSKFGTPLKTIEVVRRIWPRESETFRVVHPFLTDASRCLADFGAWSLNAYVPGRVLSDAVSTGTVGDDRMVTLAEFFAILAGLPRDGLPSLPADWLADGDGLGFPRRQAGSVADRAHRPNLRRFAPLGDELGIPEDAMERFLHPSSVRIATRADEPLGLMSRLVDERAAEGAAAVMARGGRSGRRRVNGATVGELKKGASRWDQAREKR